MIELMEKIKAFAESQDQLENQAVQQYQPIVSQYILDHSTDGDQIAFTLDFMLDFCFYEQMLALYRKLCRHLYSFAPALAVAYIDAYRERWDEDGQRFGNHKMG